MDPQTKADELYEMAINEYLNNRITQAMTYLHAAADLNHPMALYELAWRYYKGFGLEIDKGKGEFLYMKALEILMNKDMYDQFRYIDGTYDTVELILRDIVSSGKYRILKQLYNNVLELKKKVYDLEAKNNELHEQKKHLQAQLDYQPNGRGYLDAKKEFELLSMESINGN